MNDSTANGNSNAPTPSGGEERHPPQDPPSLPDQTVISQRPVAGPEDFYHSLPFLEMARHLIGKQLDHFVLDELVGAAAWEPSFEGVTSAWIAWLPSRLSPTPAATRKPNDAFASKPKALPNSTIPISPGFTTSANPTRGPTSSLNSSKGSIFAISLPNVVRLALMIRLLHQTNR